MKKWRVIQGRLRTRLFFVLDRFFPERISGVCYWKMRAEAFGIASVLNLAHGEAGIESVTEKQKREIYPFLKSWLDGTECLVLDFGCGPGRFTKDLASMIQGKAIGVDPVSVLLSMAPSAENVEYRLMREGVIPVPDSQVDVAWVCLVLGGLTDSILQQTARELRRVMKGGALLFLIENTSVKENGPHWIFRTHDEYRQVFSWAKLTSLHDYEDLGERISIMAGRKFEG